MEGAAHGAHSATATAPFHSRSLTDTLSDTSASHPHPRRLVPFRNERSVTSSSARTFLRIR